MKRLINIGLILLLFVCSKVQAAPILNGDVSLNEEPVTAVPENNTYMIMAAGLTIMGLMVKHNKGRDKSRQTRVV